MKFCTRVLELPVTRISLTYIRRKRVSVVVKRVNREISLFDDEKPMQTRVVVESL